MFGGRSGERRRWFDKGAGALFGDLRIEAYTRGVFLRRDIFLCRQGRFQQLGVVGPMARRGRDVERLFEVMAGPDIGDPASAPVPLRVWRDDEILRLRMAYFEDDG